MTKACTYTRPRMIALLVAGALFMEMLDGTIIATALPQMAATFHISPVDLNIGMSAYLLSNAVFIPISGWIADCMGARTVFCCSIALFTVASFLCGQSNGLFQFISARILQGVAGAMMVPVGRLIVLRITAKQDLMNAIACITWPALVAPIIGPPLGGFLTTFASWRWIFFLNLPLGILALALTIALVPNSRTAKKKRLDTLGFGFCAIACVLLMYGLELIGQSEIHWLKGGFLLSCSLVFWVLLVRRCLVHPEPIIDFVPLKVASFAVSIRGGSLFRIAINAVPFLLPLLFQAVFRLNPFVSGLLVLALFAGNLCIKPATTPILRRFGFRNTLLVNGLLVALSIGACAFLAVSTPRVAVVCLLFVCGMARSMQFTSINTMAFADLSEERVSGANTLFCMMQQMSMAMGVAFGASALRFAVLLHSPASVALTSTDFAVAFTLVGLLALVAVFDFITLKPSAGAHVTGHYSV